MSEVAVQSALEQHLTALGGLDTAWENVSFAPVDGVPFQRVNMLPLTPEDEVMGRGMVKLRGLLQVTLCYPSGSGRGAVQARADALRLHFKPPKTLTQNGVQVQVNDTINVGSGFADGARWCVPVTIPWFAYVFR
jgi:hypothetical protein